MNNDKAREYFSAYREGSLEPGLRASLERRMRDDADLRAEYDAFETTLGSLEGLRHEAIAVPAYLSDRIAARLDSAKAAKPAPFWASWFAPRPAPLSYYTLGLAAAALVAAVGLREFPRSPFAAPAEFAPVTASDDGESMVWMSDDGAAVNARFLAGGRRTVTVTPDGGEPQSFDLSERQAFDLTLRNPGRSARRFRIAQGNETIAVVAVPGSRLARREGSGTLTEMASALADAYRTPVVVKSGALGQTVRWSLAGNDARLAAQTALEGHGSAVALFGNVLQIGR